VNQITIALNGARNLLAEVGSAVKRVLNGLHGEVRVTTVHDFKKCNLGVTCEVNILPLDFHPNALLSLVGVEYTLRMFKYG